MTLLPGSEIVTAHAVRLFRRALRSLQIRLAAPFTDISEQAEAPGMSFFNAANRHRNSGLSSQRETMSVESCLSSAFAKSIYALSESLTHLNTKNIVTFPSGVRYSGRNFCVLTNPVSSSRRETTRYCGFSLISELKNHKSAL